RIVCHLCSPLTSQEGPRTFPRTLESTSSVQSPYGTAPICTGFVDSISNLLLPVLVQRVVLLRDSLVRGLRHRRLGEQGRPLQGRPKCLDVRGDFLHGVLAGLEVRRERHGVVGRVRLVHLLEQQHFRQGQVGSRLHDVVGRVLPVQLLHLGKQTVLGGQADGRGAGGVHVRFHVVP